MTTRQEHPPFTPLVADILAANAAQTASVTNSLIESLEAQLAYEQARRAAVLDGVMVLVGGKYMPTPAAIENALFPSDAVIDKYREPRRPRCSSLFNARTVPMLTPAGSHERLDTRPGRRRVRAQRHHLS